MYVTQEVFSMIAYSVSDCIIHKYGEWDFTARPCAKPFGQIPGMAYGYEVSGRTPKEAYIKMCTAYLIKGLSDYEHRGLPQ